MAKRKGKRNVKQQQQTSGDQSSNPNCATNANDQSCQFTDNEVERRVAAIVAIRDVEIGQLLTGLRLIRSNFSNEKLQTPFLHYLQENLPNLTIKTNEEDGQFEVEWKRMDANLCVSQADESNMAESILQQISKAYPNFSAAGMPSVGGFEISSKTVNTTDILSDADFRIPDFVMEEPSESQNLGLQNPFQTPGADSQRLSVGMTPKTLRLPKPGEMLLSVRGSPLGVYKEDNMEAIHESEESQGD